MKKMARQSSEERVILSINGAASNGYPNGKIGLKLNPCLISYEKNRSLILLNRTQKALTIKNRIYILNFIKVTNTDSSKDTIRKVKKKKSSYRMRRDSHSTYI